jgi:hypothetical protein
MVVSTSPVHLQCRGRDGYQDLTDEQAVSQISFMIKTEPASLTLVHFARCIAGYALVIALTQLSGVHGDETMTLEPGLKQLFLDDQAVEEMKGLRRRMHQPEKKGPVLKADVPSDGEWVQTVSAPMWIPDEGAYGP